MSKKNLILGGILIGLLVLAFVYEGPFKDWKINNGKPENFLADVDVESVDRIEIGDDDNLLAIVKKEEGWLIEGTKDFFVKDEIMKSALDSLESATDLDLVLVSENKEKKNEFNTSEETGLKLNLKKGDDVLSQFTIGKSGNEFGSSYIAQVYSDSTYLVKSGLTVAFGHDNWYDKTILSLDKESIDKIRFQYPSREFTVEKNLSEGDEESVWSGILPYKFSVNQDKLSEVVDILSDMEAVSVPVQSFEGTGLEKNNIIVQVTGEDIDAVIMIGDDNGEEQYYAKRGDSDNIYLISKEERDVLEKRISDLR